MRKNHINYYFILNISPAAKSEEIKSAYLKLAKTYHPDKNKGNKIAEIKFRQINEAWETLKDPKKRKLFDENLKKRKQQSSHLPRDLSKSSSPAKTLRKEKAIDLEFPLKVSLEDICQPCSKTIHYFKSVNGTKIKSTFVVQIPSGVRHGVRLRFKGEGGAEGRKLFGDLYVQICLKNHRLFQLVENSDDLILNYPISFISAVQGEKLDIPSPYGFLAFQLAPPVSDGELLKIKGYGLPKFSRSERGDLFLRILIDYPGKEGLEIKEQMKGMSFDKQKAYVEQFKNQSFIYPRLLKFQRNLQKLRTG